eukprot:13776097-Alexandrium_andersonii.AAC.1
MAIRRFCPDHFHQRSSEIDSATHDDGAPANEHTPINLHARTRMARSTEGRELRNAQTPATCVQRGGHGKEQANRARSH